MGRFAMTGTVLCLIAGGLAVRLAIDWATGHDPTVARGAIPTMIGIAIVLLPIFLVVDLIAQRRGGGRPDRE